MGMKIQISIETGKKKTFATAVDWPGWSRSGKNESAAVKMLLDYAPRFAQALALCDIPFSLPAAIDTFEVIERLAGDTSTEYGVPARSMSIDLEPLSPQVLDLQRGILQAGWQSFDRAVEKASGLELRKGPRGGGRELAEIQRHVADAEYAYLKKIGYPIAPSGGEDPIRLRADILSAVDAASRGELPRQGPRGGQNWTLRYFIRRAAWHVFDHAWEIEDRIP